MRGGLQIKVTASYQSYASWAIFTAIVVLGSCRSDSKGQSPRAPDRLYEQRSNLTASTNLASALQGKVEPVPDVTSGGFIAASTPGSPAVGDDGSASYRVPIWVPDGIAGLKPSLAIQYNSRAGAGILGPRWYIAGLSAVTRCRPTLAHDGTNSPLSYSGDEFCLDGQRLVRINAGAPVPYSEYQTRLNPFAKIIANYDSVGVSDFQVNQTDGLIYYYGRTSASRVEGSPPQFPSGTIATARQAFYLDKIQDRFGNSILIQYNKLGYDQTPGTAHPQVPILVPSTIQWGGTGDTAGLRSVQFNYLPYATLDPRHTRFVRGLGIAAGQLLTSLDVHGPNGVDGTPLLKTYQFGYDTPTTTGETLLKTIKECDANNVCKHPTTIQWEAGSSQYTRTDLGVTDVSLPGKDATFADIYKRLYVVDLNHDGLDDVIYRAVTAAANGTSTCLGYAARLAVRSGGSIVLGDRVELPLGTEPDPACATGQSASVPYSGDLIIADLDRDGFPDLLSPVGNGGPVLQYESPNPGNRFGYPPGAGPNMTSYNAHLNGRFGNGTQSFTTFNGAIAFEDTSVVDTGNKAVIAIGDVDGDGWPDVLRPTKAGGVWAATIQQGGVTGRTVLSQACQFSVLDMDGDGRSEILCDSQSGPATVVSPTMNGSVDLPPVPPPESASTYPRWFLDLNGDGLTDVAYPGTPDGSAEGITTRINTGAGLSPEIGQALPVGARIAWSAFDGFDSGVRVGDFNEDGRQDLALVDNGAGEMGSTRSTVVLLMSDGTGGFTVQNTTIPLGDPASGTRAADTDSYSQLTNEPVGADERGYNTSVVGDLNGDGLPDFVQLEGGRLVVYLHGGNAPDLVTSISEGTGRSIAVGYSPAPPSDCASDPGHLRCVGGGRLASVLDISGYGAESELLTFEQRFSYSAGSFDAGGEGFLGFSQRDIWGPASRHTMITYSPQYWIPLGAGYTHPLAFRPGTISTDIDTPQGPNSHHFHSVGFDDEIDTSDTIPTMWAGTVRVATIYTSNQQFDCPGNVSGCTGPLRALSERDESVSYDDCGKVLTRYVVNYSDPIAPALQWDQDTATYTSGACPDHFLKTDTRTSSTPAETVTRTTLFTPDTSANAVTGLATGAVQTVEIEPTGDASTHLIRTIGRDDRGRLQSVSDQDVATGETRTTGYLYEDADGVYVTTTNYPATSSAALSTRAWRHPGLGVVVEVDDPNRLAAVTSYDTFGRPLSKTQVNGATATITYQDTQDPLAQHGVNLSVVPDGQSTRRADLHLDSFGREVRRDEPIDGARRRAEITEYDALGRRYGEFVQSEENGTSTTIAGQVVNFDDLDRPTLVSKLIWDGSIETISITFDGLSATATDGSNRSTTRIVDGMGRLSIHRAVLPTPDATFPDGPYETSDATYSYGPFSVFEHEGVEDGSGSTDVQYDTLGRPTSVTRQTAGGPRVATYNAFGEMTTLYKLNPVTGEQLETLTYGHDALGRITSMTSAGFGGGPGVPPALNRAFYWDQAVTLTNGVPTGTTSVQNGLGNLIDAIDFNNGTQIHQQFDTSGNLSKRTTTLAQPQPQSFTFQYVYDPYGRLSQLTYPAIPGEVTPFGVKYLYDQFSGIAADLLDAGDPNAPAIWSATDVNEHGQITHEILSVGDTATIQKSTDYFLPTGQLSSVSLSTSGTGPPEAQLSYTYQADGLPATAAFTGPGSSWTSTFDYDNLGRLSYWQSDLGAPAVTYGYDSDGNLASRKWSGETVTYGYLVRPSTMGESTVTITQGGQSTTDHYPFDGFGRVYGTPLVSIWSTEDDQPGVITTAGGRVDTLVYDATGQRALTLFDDQTREGSHYTVTLDDLFELQSDAFGVYGPPSARFTLRANGRVVGDVIRQGPTDPRSAVFYLQDNVGTVVAEATSDGTVSARLRRDPFGNAFVGDPYLPPDAHGGYLDGTTDFGFGDHKFDLDDWGTVDMIARQYSPRLGRFLNPDTILAGVFDRRNHNPFAYVWNNPTTFNDPTGHYIPDIVGGPGADSGPQDTGPISEEPQSSEPPETSGPPAATPVQSPATPQMSEPPGEEPPQPPVNTGPGPEGDYRPMAGPPSSLQDIGHPSVSGIGPSGPAGPTTQGGIPYYIARPLDETSISGMGVQNLGIFGYGFAGPGTIGLPALATLGVFAGGTGLGYGAASLSLVVPETAEVATSAPAWTDFLPQAAQRLAQARLTYGGVGMTMMAISRSQALNRMQGLAVQVEAHLSKIAADPASLDANHWRVEVQAFLGEITRLSSNVGVRTGAQWVEQIAAWTKALEGP
jgi:RHS repeat-associated protein